VVGQFGLAEARFLYSARFTGTRSASSGSAISSEEGHT
jgi:hypothetical protein